MMVEEDNDDLPQVRPDKLEAHNRQQLSAMLDGELAPDQARFLLRRLEHDRELAGRWERWQLCGEVMRGRAEGLLRPDFAERVMLAIAQPAAVAADRAGNRVARGKVARWSAAAVAASVALVALFAGRQALDRAQPIDGGTKVELAASAATAPSQGDPGQDPARPAQTQTPANAAGQIVLASAVAAAEVPRRAATRRNVRSQSQRAALRNAATRNEPAVLVAAAAPSPAAVAQASDPFSPQSFGEPRPWPRAVLPNLRGGAGVAVDYETASPSFYPFQPRPLPEDGAEPAQPEINGPR